MHNHCYVHAQTSVRFLHHVCFELHYTKTQQRYLVLKIDPDTLLTSMFCLSYSNVYTSIVIGSLLLYIYIQHTNNRNSIVKLRYQATSDTSDIVLVQKRMYFLTLWPLGKELDLYFLYDLRGAVMGVVSTTVCCLCNLVAEAGRYPVAYRACRLLL